MARPVYSSAFFYEDVATGGTLGPVFALAGQTLVLRQFRAWTSPAGIGNELALRMLPGALNIVDFNNLAAGQNNPEWQGRIVVPPGFGFEVVSVSGGWNVYLGGYTLTAA